MGFNLCYEHVEAEEGQMLKLICVLLPVAVTNGHLHDAGYPMHLNLFTVIQLIYVSDQYYNTEIFPKGWGIGLEKATLSAF